MFDTDAYEITDPKHPAFHDTFAMIWDNRDKFESPCCGPNGCGDDMIVCSCSCDADCECKEVRE